MSYSTACLAYGILAFALIPWITGCQSPSPANAIQADLIPLQGRWEGSGAGGPCFITISGDTLSYQAGSNWWKTTFTLPAQTNPQQLHATIRESSPPTNGIGTVVFAIFKIEKDTLTLAEIDGGDQAPKSFDAAASVYVLNKVVR